MPSRAQVQAQAPTRAQALMGPYALYYFYRRRLRAHAVQETLAALGVAVAVALVLASVLVSQSVTGSAREVVHAVIGPATLQIRARANAGLPEGMLARVQALPGVKQAAPLLETPAAVAAPGGHFVNVDLAGTDTSLVVLDGLAHTLPVATLAPGGIGLSRSTAAALGAGALGTGALGTGAHGGGRGSPTVTLALRGRASALRVSAVLGPEAFGALAHARVAVMPLGQLQRLAGLPGQLTRVLVQVKPGREARVRAELARLAGSTLTVQGAEADMRQLEQALAPSEQASALFATISGLLGFLFAFGALLLTVPERRRAIADMRLVGARRTAIAQMFLFQTLCLGVAASALGVLGGYLLAEHVFHPATGYLAGAFTLGSGTVVTIAPVLACFIGGVLTTTLACALPLADLRRAPALDGAHGADGLSGAALLDGRARAGLALVAGTLLAATVAIFTLHPALALLACVLLALATLALVPLALAGVLALAHMLCERRRRLTLLPVALSSLRGATLRSLALAATGAVALFGAVALGGGRDDLLRGISGFARSYAADAQVWVTNPGDNQATADFRTGGYAGRNGDASQRRVSPVFGRIASVPGVAGVSAFQGGFMELPSHPSRRVWIIARPPGGDREVLKSQIVSGDLATTLRRLSAGGWIAVSAQIAREHHTGVGGSLTMPTPSGYARMRIAATTTNLAWSPGAIFIGTADFARLWHTGAPTALAVSLRPGASPPATRAAIAAAIGAHSGLEVVTAATREAKIDTLTGEGLAQLSTISDLLLAAAILALGAALASAIWQRRIPLAELRLTGVSPARLRRLLLLESALLLCAGALVGALAGIYGQLVIDAYLAHVTGFPVARVGASLRPLGIFALVTLLALALASIPGYLVSNVPATVALDD